MEETPAQTKEGLEIEKLDLEIGELKMSWWKRPTYILAGLPTILAVASLIYAFSSGYFQAAAIELRNEKFVLQQQKDQLLVDIANIEKDRAALEKRKADVLQALAEAEKLLKDVTANSPSAATAVYDQERLRKMMEKLIPKYTELVKPPLE